MKYLRSIAIIFCTVAVAWGSDLAASYPHAAALADLQEKAPATREYFSQTLMPYYAQNYGRVLQNCFSSVQQPDGSAFAFVAAIAVDGRVARIYEDQKTNISRCLLETLKNDRFPAPPESPFYLHIEMKFTGSASSQNGSADSAPPLVLGPNKYSYTFGVPAGWEFSFEQARQHGVTLAFFPKGGSFTDSSTIIYVNELENPCSGACLSPVSQAIAKTLRDAKADNPTLEASTADPIPMKDGARASVRTLKGAHDPRDPQLRDNQALAFIGHDETIILVVLSARDPKTWDNDYAAFREVIAGHKFFTCESPYLAVPCQR
jgi:hypothetical protein